MKKSSKIILLSTSIPITIAVASVGTYYGVINSSQTNKNTSEQTYSEKDDSKQNSIKEITKPEPTNTEGTKENVSDKTTGTKNINSEEANNQNNDQKTETNTENDSENLKKQVNDSYKNIFDEQQRFWNLYQASKAENTKYKYEFLFDEMDKIIENFDQLEKPIKYDEQELNTYKKAFSFLHDKFSKMEQLKSNLSTQQDTQPEYYSENFNKNNIKKDDNNFQNNYNNYPELEAIEKSTNNQNNNFNPERAFMNSRALKFIDLAKSNIRDFDENNYTNEQKKKLTAFLQDTIIKKEKDKSTQIRLVFDWIRKHVRYAKQPNQAKLNPFLVKEYLYAVCGGYSILYKAFLDLLNIKSIMVIGWSSAGAHQWNAILDPKTQQWFFSDATWGVVSEKYFKLDPKEISNDHMVERVLSLDHLQDNIKYEYWNGLSVKNSLVNNPNIPDKLNDIIVENISDSILNNDKIHTLRVPRFVKNIEYAGTRGIHDFELVKDNNFFSSQNGLLYSKNFKKLLMTPKNSEEEFIVIPKETVALNDGKELFESPFVKSIEVESGNFALASYKGVLYNNDFSQMLSIPSGLTDLIVHSRVKFQGQEISFKDNIKTVILNEGITTIEDFTFNNLKNLEFVLIPSTIKEIKDNAFWQINDITLKTHEYNKYVEEFAKNHKFKYEIINSN
ncbi:transglutaminase domain-containing protein [Mycoplasma zalophi]|uniref:transglutaminase domain-containing protein n=1 Tax=Mycoplasma zalophi TaxID=191287 RepID=UPI001C11B190|nr:transglutaminase domain-containing protein [Mycoplasma zalophi]MBU4691097.1 leucine-rich repeat protein [Mycoplasma zalophi]